MTGYNCSAIPSWSGGLLREYVMVWTAQRFCHGVLTTTWHCAMLAGVATTKRLAKSQKDKKREYVLREMDAQRMTAVEAARSLGLSERQVRRLLAAYRQEGAAAVVHGNHGRTPTNALTPDVRQMILDLAQTTYVGFNQTHFTEKLHT